MYLLLFSIGRIFNTIVSMHSSLKSHTHPEKVVKDMYAYEGKKKKKISSENLSQSKLLAKLNKKRFQEKIPES